jgi:hypothetical protein
MNAYRVDVLEEHEAYRMVFRLFVSLRVTKSTATVVASPLPKARRSNPYNAL